MWDIVHKFPNLKRINIMGLFMEDSIKDTANSLIDLFDSYGMNIEVRVILDSNSDFLVISVQVIAGIVAHDMSPIPNAIHVFSWISDKVG